MSLLNIVIHMLFASIGLLSVEREVENKITIWYQQEKSFNEYRNKFHVNYGLCWRTSWSHRVVTISAEIRSAPVNNLLERRWNNGHLFLASCRTA